MANAEDYPPPPPPTTLSLAGSAVTGVCNGDVPYIVYDINLVDPGNIATSHTAYLTLSGSGQSTKILLGEIVNGKLSGSVLWPGASVGPDGEPTGWPGWMQVGGTWVQTTGNFGWTRSISSALITVNPEVVVALSYPPASPSCVTSPPNTTTASSGSSGLASTGVSQLLVPIGFAAFGAILLGAAVFLLLRRRTSTR
ncbi:MAG: cell wall protein [Leifsonia sp.]